MSLLEKMEQVDDLLTHVWMVRTFLKHSEEAEEDEDLQKVHRILYDYTTRWGYFGINGMPRGIWIRPRASGTV